MRLNIGFAGAVIVLSATAVFAHHSVPVNFDQSREILIEGVLVEVKWLNPHSHFLIEVVADNGTTESWLVEHGSVNAMRRSDFGMYMHLFEVGTELSIIGWPGWRDRTIFMNRAEVSDGGELRCVISPGRPVEPCVP